MLAEHAPDFERLPFPVGAVTPVFERVYSAYPRGYKKQDAAKVFYYLAQLEGGEPALAARILAALQGGMLKRAPYTGPLEHCPSFATFLKSRGWEDADDRRPASATQYENL